MYIPVVVDHRSEKRHPRQLKPLSCTNTDAARKAVSATKAVSSMGALVAIGHTVPKGDGISPKRLKTETVAGASAFSVRGSGAGRVLAGMQHPHQGSTKVFGLATNCPPYVPYINISPCELYVPI